MSVTDGNLAAIIRHVGEALHGPEAGESAAVFVDPLLRDPFDDGFLAECGVERLRIRVPNRNGERSGLPYLLPLPGTSGGTAALHKSCLEALEEQSNPDREARQGFAIGPWFTFYGAADELTRHWAMASTVRMKGQGRRHLRLSDRRVLQWLWRRLDAAERRFVMGPMVDLRILARDGTLVRLQSPSTEDISEKRTIWQLPSCALEQCEGVQAMLRGWSQFEPHLPADHLERAEHALTEAVAAGAHGLHDQVLLGAYVLQVGPNICRSVALRDIVRHCYMNGESLSLRLSRISDSEWDQLADVYSASPNETGRQVTLQGEISHGRW